MTANFNKDNLKEGMTVYLLYTGYDLSLIHIFLQGPYNF